MSRKKSILIILLLVTKLIFGLYSDDFLIGAYTKYLNMALSSQLNIPASQLANEVGSYMHEAHFNCVMASEHPDIFSQYELDSIVKQSSIRLLSYLNNWYYEPEYLYLGPPNASLSIMLPKFGQ